MERFGKTFSIFFDENKDCAATRMVNRLKDAENEGRGVQIMLMRQWIQAGFLLEEIGRGLDTSLIDMDQDGVFHSMTKADQAGILIKMIEQKIWQHKLMESAKSAPIARPAAEKEPEPAMSEQKAQALEAKKRDKAEKPPAPAGKVRRRPASIVV